MAITAYTVYAGARQTQYNPQPIGFYHNVASADNAATAIAILIVVPEFSACFFRS